MLESTIVVTEPEADGFAEVMLVFELTSPVPERRKLPVATGWVPFFPVSNAAVPDGAFPEPDGMTLGVIVPLVLTLSFVLVPPLEITGALVTPVLMPVGVVVTTAALVLEDRGMVVTTPPEPVEVVLSVHVVSMLDDAPAVTTAVTVEGRWVTVETCTLVISLIAVAGYPGIPTPPVTVSTTVAMTVAV